MHSTLNQDETDVLLLQPPFSVTYLRHWSQGQLSKQICSGLPLPNHLPNSSNGPSPSKTCQDLTKEASRRPPQLAFDVEEQ